MRKLTKEEFVKRAREVHEDKYGYEEFEYINTHTKGKIYCYECKKYFWQIPADHLRGSGCPICGNEKRAKSKTKTTEWFITEARKIHGDKYGYEEFEYIDYKTKGKIYCRKCKKYFLQAPNIHLSGSGCRKCGYEKNAKNLRLTKKEFIKRAREVYGNKYGYEEFEYIDYKIKGKIYCYKCKKYFWQTPDHHLNSKQGCPKCGYEKMAKDRRLTKKEFIKRAREVHKNKYRYDRVKYKGSFIKVEIYCYKCKKYFWQRPANHLSGGGCPKCGRERMVDTKIKKGFYRNPADMNENDRLEFLIDQNTEKNYKKYQKGINLNKYRRSHKGFQLDHKYSKVRAAIEKRDIYIITHPVNLIVIPALTPDSKGNKNKSSECTITFKQLKKQVKYFDNLPDKERKIEYLKRINNKIWKETIGYPYPRFYF